MTTTPAPTDIDTLKALEQAATGAPWIADQEFRGQPWYVLGENDGSTNTAARCSDKADAELIVAMRNALPALLAELTQIRADRTGSAEAVEDLLAELREDLVNSLDDAMGKCPHEGVSSEWDLCNACAADTAVKIVRDLFGRERVEIAPQPAPAVWDDSVPPGGLVCSVCRTPVESEPCPTHGETEQREANPATTAEPADEPCSDKNGFHDGHDWTPDPCEPYRWCPGYPVPAAG